MRWNASVAVFRCGVSIPSAALMLCLFADQAISQFSEVSVEQTPLTESLTSHGEISIHQWRESYSPTPELYAATFSESDFSDLSHLDIVTQEPLPGGVMERAKIATLTTVDRVPGVYGQAKDLELEPVKISVEFPLDTPELTPGFLFNTLGQVVPPTNPRPDPNQDRFLQDAPAPTQEPPSIPEETQPPPAPPADPPAPEQLIPVQRVEVSGSSILTDAELQTITAAVEGRSVSLNELRQVADRITEIYLNRGYITSRAVVPAGQTIENGVVRIQVIEGRLGRIDVEGNQRLKTRYITSRIQLGANPPLSTAALEDQLRLLRADPLLENVEASLRAGDQEGESILIVRVTEASPFDAIFSVDNYSPPSIGSERAGIGLRHRNLTGWGDLMAVFYNTASIVGQGDSDVFDLIYNRPINAMNGTIQLRVAPNRNRIIQAPFDAFNIEGKTKLYEVSYRQPLVRTPVQEFALSLGFGYQQSQTFIDEEGTRFGEGPGEDGISRTSVFKFGQDYVHRDPQGAWALRSQFSLGTGLFDATTNNNPNPDGRFISWLGQVQRVQRLSDNHLLIVQGDVQLSPNALLPSQQFVIGGGLSLRGYRQNVRSGDNGFRISVEDRITLERDSAGIPLLQVAPFFDMGMVWNHKDNPNLLPDQRFLAGVGLGVLWSPLPEVNVRLDYGLPLIDLEDRGNNTQDQGFYFSVTYTPF